MGKVQNKKDRRKYYFKWLFAFSARRSSMRKGGNCTATGRGGPCLLKFLCCCRVSFGGPADGTNSDQSGQKPKKDSVYHQVFTVFPNTRDNEFRTAQSLPFLPHVSDTALFMNLKQWDRWSRPGHTLQRLNSGKVTQWWRPALKFTGRKAKASQLGHSRTNSHWRLRGSLLASIKRRSKCKSFFRKVAYWVKKVDLSRTHLICWGYQVLHRSWNADLRDSWCQGKHGLLRILE